MNEKVKLVYWRDLPGNKYLKKIEPEMLTKKNLVCRQWIRLPGIKRFEAREWVDVKYDRFYVYKKIYNDIFLPLNFTSFFDCLKIIYGAWFNSQARELHGAWLISHDERDESLSAIAEFERNDETKKIIQNFLAKNSKTEFKCDYE